MTKKSLLFVSGIVIDPKAVLKSPQLNLRSWSLNITHLNLWEKQNGKIPKGSFVILKSGWADFYDFRDKFFGFFADEESQTFPGIESRLAELLRKT